MGALTFELTQSAWGLVTRPFSQSLWESKQEDGTIFSVIKSGVNGLCVILAALAAVVMAIATPFFATIDLVYGPIKAHFFPEEPLKLPISSQAFYEGQPLESGATFEAILTWSDEEIEADSTFCFWMFPQHVEETLLADKYKIKMIQGLARMLAFYGLELKENKERVIIWERPQAEEKIGKLIKKDPIYLAHLKQILFFLDKLREIITF